jgi:hypothetical protein
MNARGFWRTIATGLLAIAVGAGLAYAKLPQPPMDDAAKAKADEAKAKAAEGAKKARADEEAAMDRVVAHYKKEKGGKTATAAPAPTPAPGSKKK